LLSTPFGTCTLSSTNLLELLSISLIVGPCRSMHRNIYEVLTPRRERGGGVNYPQTPFAAISKPLGIKRRAFATFLNRLATRGAFSHTATFQKSKWRPENRKCFEISVIQDSSPCNTTTNEIANGYPTFSTMPRLRYGTVDTGRHRPTSGIQNGGHQPEVEITF